MTAQFTVYQMFVGSQIEAVNKEVPLEPEAAVQLAISCTRTVGARIGSTCRVFITDAEDYVVWEWSYGEGLVFPTREMLSR